MEKPTLTFSDDVEAILREVPREKRDALLAWYQDRLEPQVVFTSTRVSDRPLVVGPVARLFGRKTAEPTLSVTASKFGGTPDMGDASEWQSPGRGKVSFLGQINFADLGSAHVDPLPKTGLFAIYEWQVWEGFNVEEPFFVRWYPNPDPARAVNPPATAIRSRVSYETRPFFQRTWSIPQDLGWESTLFEGSDKALVDGLADAIIHWEPQLPLDPPPRTEAERPSESVHRLLGHPHPDWAAGPELKAEERVLMRLDYDNEAGFQWGSNAVYFLIRNEDIEAHRLEKTRSTVGNV